MNGTSLNRTSELVLHRELESSVVLLKWVVAGIDVLLILINLIGTTRFVYSFQRAKICKTTETRIVGIDKVQGPQFWYERCITGG